MTSRESGRRLEDLINTWRVVVDRIEETDTSFLAFGRRDERPVVLKLIKNPGGEWLSGQVLDAFEGKGVIRVFEHVPGALLVEQLSPGTSLAGLALNGADDQATNVLATVIGNMSPRGTITAAPTVRDWVGGGRIRGRFKSSTNRLGEGDSADVDA